MAESQQKPVYKPKIPFTVALLGGLQEGKRVFIIGRVMPDSKRFYVNLQCSSDSTADIALHINPRYDEGPAHIVYNTRERNDWGFENKSECPLLHGEQFILQILVTKRGYQISLNGKHVNDYEHRIPLTRVDHLQMDQMVEVDFFACQTEEAATCKKVLIDVLKPGKDILVYGIPDPDCKRIEINLRHRFGIAFHYQCRFEENAVVRNTFENGSWGAEEKSADIPLKHGQFFQLKISCKEEQFEVFVNNHQNHTYKHRFTKLEDIDVVEVCGSLQLFSVVV